MSLSFGAFQELSINFQYFPLYTGEEKLSDNYKQEPKLSFLRKAILTIAYGLEQFHEDLCGRNFEGICPQMNPFNGSVFLNYLMNVSFQINNDLVEFDTRGKLVLI